MNKKKLLGILPSYSAGGAEKIMLVYFHNFKKLIKLLDTYKEKVIPTLPIGADLLMSKFQIPEGKTLGNKLKKIEETWVQNGFQISDKQVQQIVKS